MMSRRAWIDIELLTRHDWWLSLRGYSMGRREQKSLAQAREPAQALYEGMAKAIVIVRRF
jgi:hypothetical protein